MFHSILNIMKTITIAISMLFSITAFAESNGYNEAMEAAINQYNTAHSVAEFKNAANTFNRISNMATTEWLPEYYHAQCYILMSFMDQAADAAQKDEYLDVAEKSISSILEKQPENSEAYALQAFMNTGRLVVDPMTRGREYSIRSHESIKKSLAINPTNPRALYLQLSNEIGTAQFFGTDASVYCDRIYTLLENWDSYNNTEALQPKWGKTQVEGLAANCTTSSDSTLTK